MYSTHTYQRRRDEQERIYKLYDIHFIVLQLNIEQIRNELHVTIYGVHSLPKLHAPTWYPIMRYWYYILQHAWSIRLPNVPLCNIHIELCYMNVQFGCMSFVNLIYYYAILILYFAWLIFVVCDITLCDRSRLFCETYSSR